MIILSSYLFGQSREDKDSEKSKYLNSLKPPKINLDAVVNAKTLINEGERLSQGCFLESVQHLQLSLSFYLKYT